MGYFFYLQILNNPQEYINIIVFHKIILILIKGVYSPGPMAVNKKSIQLD